MNIEKLSDLKDRRRVNGKIVAELEEAHQKHGVEKGFLTELQKESFSSEAFWDDSQNVIVQGRTSSGKTLVAQIAAAYFGGKETNVSGKPRNSVIYLVPLRAMVSEKRAEFQQLFKETLDWRVVASSSDYQDHDQDILAGDFQIAVIVYEKFFALLAQYNIHPFIKSCGLIVVDELQMMNDEARGPKLEIALTKVIDINPHCKIMGLTTTQCDVAQISNWLDAKPISSPSRPKALEEHVVWPDLVDSRYFRYYRQTEGTDGEKEPPDKGAGEQGAKLELPGPHVGIRENERNIERKMVPPLISHILGKDPHAKILVFINFRNETRNIAAEITEHLRATMPPERKKTISDDNEHVRDLRYSDDEYGDMLEEMVPYGVAFHHGGLSKALRDFIEEEFRKDGGLIDIVVATETLAVGVNMPADVVILAGIKLPRGNSLTNEMRSHEYKNYIGRGGRLGIGAETGKSYLLAPSQAKANDYWTRFVTADTVTISSALKKLKTEEQTPYFFNLIGSLPGDGDFRVEDLDRSIAKTLTYHGRKDGGGLPSQECIKLLLRYKLIEDDSVVPQKYERTRIGVELASYALSLDTVESITGTGQAISQAVFREYGENQNDSSKEKIMKFVTAHYLDILYRLSNTAEVKNVFVQNRDEPIFTQHVLRYLKGHKRSLIPGWPLEKILEDLDAGEPLPNQNKSFAMKRAACLCEWMKGEGIGSIKRKTGLTYISLGDLDRLGDVIAYLWEALVQVLSALSFRGWNFSEAKSSLMRLSGSIKYGVDDDLVVLASRHVPYVTRYHLINLKKEATSRNMSPEQYVLGPDTLLNQKALTKEQFRKLAAELRERYHGTGMTNDTMSLARGLQKNGRIEGDVYDVVDKVYEKEVIDISNMGALWKDVHDLTVKMGTHGSYCILSRDGKKIGVYLIEAQSKVDKDTFGGVERKLASKEDLAACDAVVFLAKAGFKMEEIRPFLKEGGQKYVFISSRSFIRLYLLSLRESASLELFFVALGFGYIAIPDGDTALDNYMKNFLADESALDRGPEVEPEKEGERKATTLYMVADWVSSEQTIKEITGRLKERFPSEGLRERFLRWGDRETIFLTEIMRKGTDVMIVVDDQFENKCVISAVVDSLVQKDGREGGKVFLLYQDQTVKEDFLTKHPLLGDFCSLCLDKSSYDNIAKELYERLTT